MSGVDQLDPVLTIRETAEYLKLSKSKVYLMVKRKEIPHLKMGKSVRIRQSDLQEWLEQKIVFKNGDKRPSPLLR